MPKELPSPELLRKLLRYEPDTGKLFWLPRPFSLFASERAAKMWHTRYSGAEAFTHTNPHGYKNGNIFGKLHRTHRVAWAIYYGEWPTHQIDHINGDKTDNRIVNLRDVIQTINQRNIGKRSDNSTGHAGVRRHSNSQKWVADITINGKTKHLGLFVDISDAIHARKAAEAGLGFTERHGS